MSKLQELINRLCPDGVPFKRFSEVLEFKRGQTITEKDSVPGEYPVIAGGQKPAYYHNDYNRSGETIAVAGSGAYAGFVTWWTTPIFLSDAFSVHPKDDSLRPKYVFYYMKNIQNKIYNTKKGSGVPHVHGSSIAKFLIPVPPMEVQEEIVRILDKYSACVTELQAELKAELQARKEQYEYYRNLLLTFNLDEGATDDEQEVKSTIWGGHSCEITWKTMGEIAKLVKTRINSNEVDSYIGVENLLKDKAGAIPTSEFPMGDSCIGFNPNDILIGNIRPYLKKIWIADRDGGTNGDVLTIRLTDTQLTPRFLYHVLASDNFFLYHNQYAKGAKMPRGDKSMVMKYNIPIPPLEVQEKIVGILDKFESLVNDLTNGLPAEIAARKEQYEYYRNKLLTFKELN